MRTTVAIAFAALALTACREDEVARVTPIEMPADTLGHYCQMLLVNHEGPKGQIHLDGEKAPIFFAQVRDTLGYLHMPEQSHAVKAVFVEDMAGAASWSEPAGWIAADAAIYVAGSDRLGGMGAPEFVPFSDEDAARKFIENHGGKILRFDEIEPADVLNNEGPAGDEDAGDIAGRLHALSDSHEGH